MSKRIIDYNYIAENISSLSRICVRVYQNQTLLFILDPSHFPVDPATLYLDDFFNIPEPVSSYITPYDQFYGIIRHEEYCLVLGPTFEIAPSRSRIREFMFELGIQKNYFPVYQQLISNTTPLPLELFLRELCLIYYFLTENKMCPADFKIYHSGSRVSPVSLVDGIPISFDEHETETSPDYKKNSDAFFDTHDTAAFEKQMLSMISEGDAKGLASLFASQSAGRPGKTSDNYLRQVKNIFISTVTLCSRAAIDGGMSAEEALTLSDRYIQHSESFSNPEQIINLQHNMVMDYATLVSEQREGKQSNKFMRTVTGYIQEHLTEDLSVQQMAKDLFVSQSHLSVKFKKETGITLSAYITEQKIKRAMKYLKNTNKTLLEISAFLGFSSQSYFQNVFKKYTGMTPKQYREK